MGVWTVALDSGWDSATCSPATPSFNTPSCVSVFPSVKWNSTHPGRGCCAPLEATQTQAVVQSGDLLAVIPGGPEVSVLGVQGPVQVPHADKDA